MTFGGGVMTFVALVAGFIYLLLGADLLVRGAVALARRLNVPPVVVAATVVGFGTSLPELVVSVQASLEGAPNLILGNVVGSNIANVLLVAGASAVVYPLLYEDRAIRRNVIIMAGSLVGFTVLAATGSLGRLGGFLLLGAFLAIMLATARSTLEAHAESDTSIPFDWVLGSPSRLSMIFTFLAIGVVALPLGSKLLVDSAIVIAERFSVSETVIGLTVLAIGTSLPELTTTILAALERRSDVAIGTIIGSNIFNILAIMGVAATMSTEAIPVTNRFLLLDVPVMLISSGFLAVCAWQARSIGRGAGIVMLITYVVYLSSLAVLT